MFTRSSEAYNLKLDEACIFLQEGNRAHVNGAFHINLPQSNSFKGIRVQLLGVLNIPRDNFLIQSDRRNMSHISGQTIGSSKCLSSFQLPAGTYEFPFSISLPHRMLETVTTQEHAYHTYHVQAIIERRFKADSIISQPIRIYNHPDLLADHRLLSSPTVESIANQNIQYCMFLPDSNIPFASRFPVKCFFTPLSKSLQLDTVKLLVMERHVLRVDATAAESALHNISTIATSRTSTIFQSEHTSFDQTSGLLATEGDEPPAEWSLSLPVQLPESFDLASQSVLAGIINISHRVVVKAQFRDTENNANITIEEEIPFSIYMTPAVIASNGEIHGHYIERFKSYECAPPAYGQHKCDAIPPEWAEYLRQFNASSQRPHYEQGTVHDMSCIPAVQGSLDIEPPVYQFCAS